MSHRRVAVWLVMTVVSARLLAGCGDARSPVGPPADPPARVMGVEIQGPASIAPGQSAQYVLVERLSDGTTRAVPSAPWASSDPSLVQVTSSGVATAQSRTGEVLLLVHTTISASKWVLVLPPNTFRLVGSVRDTDGAAIPDARVEVIGGPSATTASNGAYRVYGVPPEADVRVTRDGYIAVEQHVQLTTHGSFNFRMPVDVAGRNLSGDYTLTLESASICDISRPLAVELRRRSYDATLTQDGLRLQIVLTEPRFVPGTDNTGLISGTLTGTGARFAIGADPAGTGWFSDPWEQLPDGSTLEITGSANTTESSGVWSGELSGWFSHRGANGEPLGACDASRFTLSPR